MEGGNGVTRHSQPRVLTVVVSYRHTGDTVRCVRSLQGSSYRNHRVLVVDNTEEPDATADLREALAPEVEVLRSGRNLGYAGGNNLGLRRALEEMADFAWLVNPDAVVEPTTLARLVDTMRDVVDLGAVGPRIIHGGTVPARIWFDGGVVDWSRAAATRHRNDGRLEVDVPVVGAVDVDYITGAALLLRMRALDQIGFVPEEYFLYFEETDLCQRLLRAGWRVMVNEWARMAHYKRSATIAPTPYYVYYMTRNRLHFARRWCGLDVDDALPPLQDWLGRLRIKVAASAPAWLPVFDDLVERGIADARAGIWGPWPDIATVPTAELLAERDLY
jgi:GT2 family glycosyltransferase